MKVGGPSPEGRKPARLGGEAARCAAELRAALRRDLRERRLTAKAAMRWTGAGAATVKAWLAGRSVPGGANLVALMRHSDEVLAAVLRLAGRRRDAGRDDLGEAQRHLAVVAAALARLDAAAGVPPAP